MKSVGTMCDWVVEVRVYSLVAYGGLALVIVQQYHVFHLV